MPSAEVMAALEEFVCQLYQPETTCTDVAQLRWKIFKKSMAESEKLPPTKASLKYHIYRAHYQAMIWGNAHVANPQLPSPEAYGWKLTDNQFHAVTTDLPPAPIALIQLVRCGCGAGMCKARNCSCRKADMVCTEMCSCEAAEDTCMNTEHLPTHDDNESDSDDSSSDED